MSKKSFKFYFLSGDNYDDYRSSYGLSPQEKEVALDLYNLFTSNNSLGDYCQKIRPVWIDIPINNDLRLNIRPLYRVAKAGARNKMQSIAIYYEPDFSLGAWSSLMNSFDCYFLANDFVIPKSGSLLELNVSEKQVSFDTNFKVKSNYFELEEIHKGSYDEMLCLVENRIAKNMIKNNEFCISCNSSNKSNSNSFDLIADDFYQESFSSEQYNQMQENEEEVEKPPRKNENRKNSGNIHYQKKNSMVLYYILIGILILMLYLVFQLGEIRGNERKEELTIKLNEAKISLHELKNQLKDYRENDIEKEKEINRLKSENKKLNDKVLNFQKEKSIPHLIQVQDK